MFISNPKRQRNESEPNANMTDVGILRKRFKITMMNMVRGIMEKVCALYRQMILLTEIKC